MLCLVRGKCDLVLMTHDLWPMPFHRLRRFGARGQPHLTSGAARTHSLSQHSRSKYTPPRTHVGCCFKDVTFTFTNIILYFTTSFSISLWPFFERKCFTFAMKSAVCRARFQTLVNNPRPPLRALNGHPYLDQEWASAFPRRATTWLHVSCFKASYSTRRRLPVPSHARRQDRKEPPAQFVSVLYQGGHCPQCL